MGVVVSAKRVMRLTARHGLVPVSRSARRYSSYRGEIGEAPVIHSDRGCHYQWASWSTGSPTMLDEYMTWYRDERIKTEYGMSIMDRRIKLGLVG